MGRIELELRPDSPWDEVRERLGRIFGIANFHTRTMVRTTSRRWRRRFSRDGDITPASFRVSATRADKRLPFTSRRSSARSAG